MPTKVVELKSASLEEREEEEEVDERRQIRIAVGSTNPCKVDAVKNAFARAMDIDSHPDVALVVEGFSVESGVPDQPFGDDETREGARNRARNAYFAFKHKYNSIPHLSVGLEGGLEWMKSIPSDAKDIRQSLWCMGWMAVYGKRRAEMVEMMASPDSKFYTEKQKPIFGYAKTAMYLLPSEMATLIDDGLEMADADDKIFDRKNSKQGSGTVGVLTNNLITRADYYEPALLLALIPWIRPDVYNTAGGSSTRSSLLSALGCLTRKKESK